MDALQKRREVRKRKILQNAEGRLSRVSRINVETTHDNDSLEPSVLHTSEPNNAFITFDHTLQSSLVNSEIDGKPNGQEKIDLIKEDDSESKEENINILEEQTDGRDAKEKIKRLDELQEGENYETENREADAPTMKSASSKLRIVLMIIFASLCFYQSTCWPLVAKITGLSELGEEQQSFLIPLCLLELFFFFIPSLRKVVPGQKANLCFLGLKLCGLPPVVVENLQFIMLEILEFLTDLVIFIFVLVVLQNINDLLY